MTERRHTDQARPIAASAWTCGGGTPNSPASRSRSCTMAATSSMPKASVAPAVAMIPATFSPRAKDDFDENPLGFHARTLRSLQDSWARMAGLNLADSIGIDLHKTGYTPYISSLFLLRERGRLRLLGRRPEEMPYLDRMGRYHPGYYTPECSRSGASPLAALANILLLGKQGYRVLIGHVVEMAEMLRGKLERYPFVKVLNDYNYGPVTLIRLYPDGCDGLETYQRELHELGCGDRVIAHNGFNHRIYELIHARAMRGEGVLLSWTDCYRHTSDGQPVGAIKSFIMNPWTDLGAVETVCRQLLEARQQVIAKGSAT